MIKSLIKRVRFWRIRRKLRKEIKRMKKAYEFLPPLTSLLPLSLPTTPDPWRGVDKSLPRTCSTCGVLNVPSKIDDRMVACLRCKRVYMTKEAYDDPNIQRDMIHAQAGISLKRPEGDKND